MRTRIGAAAFALVAGTMLIAALAGAEAQTQNDPLPVPADNMRLEKPALLAQTSAPISAWPLRITYGDQSATWTPGSLAGLPHKPLTVYDAHEKANRTYSGVPLMDLLTKLGVPASPRGKDLRLYLVAQGADGYEAVYSVAEVNPELHDATVIVADTLEGKPIDNIGPFQLVATGEKRPARWVRGLIAIRVLTAQ